MADSGLIIGDFAGSFLEGFTEAREKASQKAAERDKLLKESISDLLKQTDLTNPRGKMAASIAISGLAGQVYPEPSPLAKAGQKLTGGRLGKQRQQAQGATDPREALTKLSQMMAEEATRPATTTMMPGGAGGASTVQNLPEVPGVGKPPSPVMGRSPDITVAAPGLGNMLSPMPMPRSPVEEYRQKTEIDTAQAEQAFQTRKRHIEASGLQPGTPEYVNALFGQNIEPMRPESLDQSAADLFNQYRTGKLTKPQFDEGVQALHQVKESMQKPGAPKQLWSVDKTSSTGYRVDYVDSTTEQVVSSFKDRLPPAGYLPTERTQILAVPDPNDPMKTVYQAVPITSAKAIPGARGVAAPSTPVPKGGRGATGGAPAKRGGIPEVPAVGGELPGKTIGTAPSKALQSAVQKAFTNWQDVKSRVKIMEDLRDKATADPTGASDMLLLGEHIALIWGYTKGTRMTRQMIEQHVAARPWDQAVQVAWQRVVGGKVLSPEQRQAFVEAAKLRETAMQEQYEAARRGGAEAPTPPPGQPKPGDPLGIL